jgi:hypothetical protein
VNATYAKSTDGFTSQPYVGLPQSFGGLQSYFGLQSVCGLQSCFGLPQSFGGLQSGFGGLQGGFGLQGGGSQGGFLQTVLHFQNAISQLLSGTHNG